MEKDIKELVKVNKEMNEKMTSMEKSLREIRIRLVDKPDI